MYKVYLYSYKGSGSSQRVFGTKKEAEDKAKMLRPKAYKVVVKKVKK